MTETVAEAVIWLLFWGAIVCWFCLQINKTSRSWGSSPKRVIPPIPPRPPVNRVSAGQPSCEVIDHDSVARAVPAGVRGDFVNLCRDGQPHDFGEPLPPVMRTFNGAYRLLEISWCLPCGQRRVVPLDKDPRYV